MNRKYPFGTVRAVCAALAASAAVLFGSGSASAEEWELGWTALKLNTSMDQIRTDGTLKFAWAKGDNTGSDCGSVTAQGVTFKTTSKLDDPCQEFKDAANFSISPVFTMNNTGWGSYGPTADIQSIFNSGWYEKTPGKYTFTLNGLESGQTYLVQLLAQKQGATDSYAEAPDGVARIYFSGSEWDVGGTLIGIFESTNTSYSFEINYPATYQVVNAIQVRQLTESPKPKPVPGEIVATEWGYTYPLTIGTTVDRVCVFTNVLKSFDWTVPAGITSLRYLVVGGGGGGGYQYGGGGGGGGVLAGSDFAVTEGSSLTVTVGAGGAGGAKNSTPGTNGGSSTLTVGTTQVACALGGGGGGYLRSNGLDGANGGGGGQLQGSGYGGKGAVGGHDGGNGSTAGGGGGGAGGDGGAASTTLGGAGGWGVTNDITGIAVAYAGGGGGGGNGNPASSAKVYGGEGRDGGGNGGTHDASVSIAPTAGTDGLGGGGGGGAHEGNVGYAGARGGNGVVILRYTTGLVPVIGSMSVDVVDSLATVSLADIEMGVGDDGEPATKYAVNWELTGQTAKSGTLPDQQGETASFTISNLDNGDYELAVAITTDKGKTSSTNRATFKVSVADPTAPRFDVPTVTFNDDLTYTVAVVVNANMPSNGTVMADCGGYTKLMATEATGVPATYAATLDRPVDKTFVATVTAKSVRGYTFKVSSSTYYNGELRVGKVADAYEKGRTAGAVRILREDTSGALAVNLTVDPASTAEAGVDYEALPATVTIPDGAASVDVAVVPIVNVRRSEDATVIVRLAAGPYRLGAAASATVTIVNYETEANTWGASAEGNASEAANWSYLAAPVCADTAVFDPDVSVANCVWDNAAVKTISGFEFRDGYTGTVTLGGDVRLGTLRIAGNSPTIYLNGHTQTVERVWLGDASVPAGDYAAGSQPFGALLQGAGRLRVTGPGLWVLVQ